MNGWTGAQYSLYRFVLGSALAIGLARGGSALDWAGALLAVPLALGRLDRFAAGALAGVCLVRGLPWEMVLLVLHVVTPPAPFGSWDAAGRSDPGGGWVLPAWVPYAARLAVLGGWLQGLLWGSLPLGPGFVLCHVLALDPGWLRPRGRGPATVYYDGHCGLCHRTVRFLLAEDRDGHAFRYAPLEGEHFALRHGTRELPDSVVLEAPDSPDCPDSPDGDLMVRSRAFLEIGARLGGVWRLAAGLVGRAPVRLLDTLYDAVAARRQRWFGRTDDACPRVPAELSRRFLV